MTAVNGSKTADVSLLGYSIPEILMPLPHHGYVPLRLHHTTNVEPGATCELSFVSPFLLAPGAFLACRGDLVFDHVLVGSSGVPLKGPRACLVSFVVRAYEKITIRMRVPRTGDPPDIDPTADFHLAAYYITLVRCVAALDAIPRTEPEVGCRVDLVIDECRGLLDDLWSRFSGCEREAIDHQVMRLRRWIETVTWCRSEYRDEMIRQWKQARSSTNPSTRDLDWGARKTLEALLDQFFPGWRVQA